MISLAARAIEAAKPFMAGTAETAIDTREKLAVWLRQQPREAARILADRWSLRALPIVSMYESDLLSDLVLPSFRVVASSWASVRYPAYQLEPTFAAARAAGARAFAAAARAARATDAILGYEDIDDATIRASFTFAARAFAAAADDDAEGRAFAAAAAARAIAAIASAEAGAAFWTAISEDVCARDHGLTPAEIAGKPLWPGDPPAELASMWQNLKARLHAESQDWQVWTAWYDGRLEGRIREEKRELAYVRIENALWDRGAAIVNAEIARHIESAAAVAASGAAGMELSIEMPRPDAAPPRIAACQRPVFKGFFSYSHSDAAVDPEIVEAFSAQLEKRVDAKLVNASFKIWRDTENLRAGDYWDECIKAELGAVDILIVLLTPKWISSDYCRNEFSLFELTRNRGSCIVPIYARDIETQAKFLESDQKALYDRLKRIQHQQVIPGLFARLSANERIELIENVAGPICSMIDRLRSN
ncbi:MAG: toll/interleukin-1 receptor domain-containing protein [Beijerinckiaceae bacterium]|nr:toll/interleukin-1 receptor domain-containing protein [Beijerinckiaceae bacterium]